MTRGESGCDIAAVCECREETRPKNQVGPPLLHSWSLLLSLCTFRDGPGTIFRDGPEGLAIALTALQNYKIRLDAVVEVSSPLIILSFTEDPSRGAARPSCLIHPKKEKSSVGRNDSISAFRSLGDRERTGGNIASCSWGASRCSGMSRDTMYLACELPSLNILTLGTGNLPAATVAACPAAAPRAAANLSSSADTP